MRKGRVSFRKQTNGFLLIRSALHPVLSLLIFTFEGMSALVFDRHVTSIEGLLMRRFRFFHMHTQPRFEEDTFYVGFTHKGVNVYRIAKMGGSIAMINSTLMVQ